MREIKFRAWDKEEEYFDSILAGNILSAIHGSGDSLSNEENKRYVLQQYTGLTDKNGVEIYEGDILKCKGFDDWFDQIGFYYNVVVKHTIIESGESQIAGFAYIPIDREVIGNIFETPELLKK